MIEKECIFDTKCLRVHKNVRMKTHMYEDTINAKDGVLEK